MISRKTDDGRPGSSTIRNGKQQFIFPNRPDQLDGGSKGYDSHFRTGWPNIGAGQSPLSHRTIAGILRRAVTVWVIAVVMALIVSLALVARIADRDCARLAGPGPWASAPSWLADGLTALRAEAYARCVAGEGRP